MDNKEITPAIFAPKNGVVLKRDHPELKENKKFKDLSNEEITWVWHYACKSSHLDDEQEKGLTMAERAKKAADLSFKTNTPASKEAKIKFAKLDVPERIKEAIDEMRKYNPTARDIASKIIETSFINLYNMIAVNAEDFIEVEVDEHGNERKRINFTARKQYVETVAKTSETLPELLKQLESNFGVERKENDKSTDRLIDEYHNRKKEG
ncbi:MAG TPA: hypothetical protein ACFYEK_01040 [Candidatus Wunengus sp. YC60]|uniref:hypothetical protein n=1 Tax=Candidatus Wunengus sp. YC60 TaxID=3367697 RepID=UPI004025C50E